MTISSLGGRWLGTLNCGVFHRDLFYDPFRYGVHVASRLILEATCHSYHTDEHDINEDKRTISVVGGRWYNNVTCGVFRRSLSDDPSVPRVITASRLAIKSGT